MAQEVVPGKDVVDLKALRAGVALTHVALQEALVLHHVATLVVTQEALRGGTPARLAIGGRLHFSWSRHPPLARRCVIVGKAF
jgi:hypothetical protein